MKISKPAILALSCLQFAFWQVHISSNAAQSLNDENAANKAAETKPDDSAVKQAESAGQSTNADASSQRYFYEGREVNKEVYESINRARQASELMHKSDYAAAEQILREVLVHVPDDPNILENMALCLVKTGKPEEALAYYEKISKLNPGSESCWIGWSGAYGALGRLEESARICREFLKKFPKSPAWGQMKNQAETIEKELKRLGKAQAEDHQLSGPENYLSEACGNKRYHWSRSSMPISVFIEKADSVANWQEEFNQIMQEAFEEWASVSDGLISFKFVDKAQKAEILCSWTDDTKDLKNSAELGRTDTSFSDNGDLIKASIKMLTVHSLDPSKKLTAQKIRQTALHEVGHALGISGHSSKPGDAMYFASINQPDPKLSQRDAQSIKLLYGDR